MSDFSDVRALREQLGMSQRAISEMLNIPLRTWENWEGGLRTPPQYVIDLILFRLNAERNNQM